MPKISRLGHASKSSLHTQRQVGNGGSTGAVGAGTRVTGRDSAAHGEESEAAGEQGQAAAGGWGGPAIFSDVRLVICDTWAMAANR